MLIYSKYIQYIFISNCLLVLGTGSYDLTYWICFTYESGLISQMRFTHLVCKVIDLIDHIIIMDSFVVLLWNVILLSAQYVYDHFIRNKRNILEMCLYVILTTWGCPGYFPLGALLALQVPPPLYSWCPNHNYTHNNATHIHPWKMFPFN